MTRYVISDTHLDHENIIEYCNRPFDDVDEMNKTIIENWNSIVDSSDSVIFLGDLGWWDVENVIRYNEQLNGEMLLIRGNHDEFDAEDVPFPVVESCTITHNGRDFYCTHRPVEIQDNSDHWNLHGHHHNNDMDNYPFIDPECNRVNLSVELLGYEPLALNRLCELLDRQERYTVLSDTISPTE